jgi:imidazolonepropionase-like amidohydrolase
MQRKLNGLRNLHWQVLFLSENGISRPDIIPRTQNSCADHAAAAKKARIGFASLLFLLLLIPVKKTQGLSDGGHCKAWAQARSSAASKAAVQEAPVQHPPAMAKAKKAASFRGAGTIR